MWHNFRTGKEESGTPKDWHDVIPQDELTQSTFDGLVQIGMSEMDAATEILKVLKEAFDVVDTIMDDVEQENKRRMN